MPIIQFPNPEEAGPEGILAVGGDLHPDSLLLAYRQGIFPWPVHVEEGEEPVLAWFCPPQRAILEFSRLHVSRSLSRAKKSSTLRFTIDKDFSAVVKACAAAPRPGQAGTWITSEMTDAYIKFHRLGFAHSVEVWDDAGSLVGGIYGTSVEGVFAGESMFHRVPNASKLALLFLVDHLRGRGAAWIDIQMLTPHLKALGAHELSRGEFLRLLRQTQTRRLKLF